jgi:hypothetical protein
MLIVVVVVGVSGSSRVLLVLLLLLLCLLLRLLLRRVVVGKRVGTEVIEVHPLVLELQGRHAPPVLIHPTARAYQAVGARSARGHGLVVGNRRQAIIEAVGSDRRHLRHAHGVTRVRVRHGGARHVVQIRVLLRSGRLPVLEMVLRVLQVVGTSRVSPADGTLLEMTLQDITSAECVFAEMAGVGALARVYVM